MKIVRKVKVRKNKMMEGNIERTMKKYERILC